MAWAGACMMCHRAAQPAVFLALAAADQKRQLPRTVLVSEGSALYLFKFHLRNTPTLRRATFLKTTWPSQHAPSLATSPQRGLRQRAASPCKCQLLGLRHLGGRDSKEGPVSLLTLGHQMPLTVGLQGPLMRPLPRPMISLAAGVSIRPAHYAPLGLQLLVLLRMEKM